jgi:cell division septation protein DedD
MPKNETGEFELVLGDRQLLSGFAVVVILFGVFFAMGYVVGRSSKPSARVETADAGAAQPSAASSAAQPDPGRAQTPAPVPPPPPAEEPPAESSSAASPQPQTQTEATPKPVKESKPAEKTEEKAPTVQTAESMRPGTYLQVMAVTRSDAEVIAKALMGKGFPALITPSSREGIFRVLVGPYKDATSLGNAKTELENTGFHPIPQKITDKS